jgi:hypothetical protein
MQNVFQASKIKITRSVAVKLHCGAQKLPSSVLRRGTNLKNGGTNHASRAMIRGYNTADEQGERMRAFINLFSRSLIGLYTLSVSFPNFFLLNGSLHVNSHQPSWLRPTLRSLGAPSSLATAPLQSQVSN